MHLHWLSPAPPAHTDIAWFSVPVVEQLRRRHQVTWWVDRLPGRSDDLPEVEFRRFELTHTVWRELNRGDAAIFHMGNNAEFHGWIWNALSIFPGVVVIHDPAIQEFASTLGGGPSGHRELMTRHYGAAGAQAHRRFLEGTLSACDLSTLYPLTRAMLDNCLAGVVHWPGVLERDVGGPDVPVRCIPLSFPARRHAPRRRPIGAGSPHRLIAFGYFGENRRLDVTLDALAGYPNRDAFRLDIYGTYGGPVALPALIEQRGLGDVVTFHGYTAPSELDVLLQDADIMINLRGPTVGELSGSQLRAWDHSLPSIVSRTGWYATIPDDAVAFVDAEDRDREIADFRRHLDGFLDDPGSYAARGRVGRAILERDHSPAAYAEALAELCGDAESLRLAWAERRLARRVGRLGRAWPEPEPAFEHLSQRILDLFER